MEEKRDTESNKKIDVKILVMLLNNLTEGDKREVMGYIRCLFSSNRIPDTHNTDNKEISEITVKEAI